MGRSIGWSGRNFVNPRHREVWGLKICLYSMMRSWPNKLGAYSMTSHLYSIVCSKQNTSLIPRLWKQKFQPTPRMLGRVSWRVGMWLNKAQNEGLDRVGLYIFGVRIGCPTQVIPRCYHLGLKGGEWIWWLIWLIRSIRSGRGTSLIIYSMTLKQPLLKICLSAGPYRMTS